MQAEVKYADGRLPFVAGAAYVPGEVIARPDGTLAVHDGLVACDSGDLISPEPVLPTKIIEVDCGSSTTFSAGATVYWDDTNNVATATSSGNTKIGIAARAKTSGQLKVLVNCVP